MRTPVADYLSETLERHRGNDAGAVADYIPELAAADPETFGISLATTTGHRYSAGDDEHEFSIQSISKPFAYAAALLSRGFETVMEVVGMEPSGEAFNELSLEKDSHRPKNPMINAGALAVQQLLVGPEATRSERVEHVRAFCSELAGRELEVDTALAHSEFSGADRNLALAHMLRNYGVLRDPAPDVVFGYTEQCSIMVTVRDLAMMAATLANGGVQPVSGAQVLPATVARQTLSVMSSAGMYDASGAWFAEVGIPAKSAISGGLIGALPGQAGIALVSPRLDAKGNSVRGVSVFRGLSQDMGLHVMESEPYGSTVLRGVRERDGSTVYALQGIVQFTGAESVLFELQRRTNSGDRVTIDLQRVDRVTRLGRRMLLEGLHRLEQEGCRVVVDDPDAVLGGGAPRAGARRILPSDAEATDPDPAPADGPAVAGAGGRAAGGAADGDDAEWAPPATPSGLEAPTRLRSQ